MGSAVGAGWHRRERPASSSSSAGPASSSPGPDPIGPTVAVGATELNTRRVIDEYAATVRGAAALFAALAGLAATPVTAWQRPICVGVLIWAVVRLTWRRRPAGPVTIAVDLAVGCLVGATAPLTTSLPDLTVMRGFAVNVVNPISLTLAWYRRRGPAIGLSCTVLACYLASLSIASGAPVWTLAATYVLPVQTLLSWTLVGTFLPAARSADAEAARRVTTAIELEVAAARRTAEREHWAVMHDTAASTLLMVGDGVPAAANARIRRQAARDLKTIGGSPDSPPDETGDLPQAVRQLVAGTLIEVRVRVDGVGALPADVVRATVSATRELLTNVERHAGIGRARIDLVGVGTGFELSVQDDGPGFDPRDLGRGLRVSVVERMHRVGGQVRIDSQLGRGSTTTIGWSPR
ncbi:sensor histidine kinase [Nakamurella sp.]|uniref:sensor histidine kinase n=1 Tax=Nakamurella sp. TaxID=1869182 RepID=UPI003783F8CF